MFFIQKLSSIKLSWESNTLVFNKFAAQEHVATIHCLETDRDIHTTLSVNKTLVPRPRGFNSLFSSSSISYREINYLFLE